MRSEVFHDFDAFAQSVVDVDSRMMLRNPKQRQWRTTAVRLGDIDVQLGELGSGNIAQGELRSDGYMCYLPLTAGVEYKANGAAIEKDSFAILEPGCEFCITTKAEHDWCVIFVPKHIVERNAPQAITPSRSCRVTRSNPLAASRLRTFVSEILVTAREHPNFETSPAALNAAAQARQIFTDCSFANNIPEPPPGGRPKIPRVEIIRRSLELLEHPGITVPTVEELATASDVSERTLRTAFSEYFGVGPVRYLQLRQLHQIRSALLNAHLEGSTVSEILLDHGVWEFSRFAMRYRQLFDESPSATLRSKRDSRNAEMFG